MGGATIPTTMSPIDGASEKYHTEALAWIEKMKRDHADGGLDLDAKYTTVGEYLDRCTG